MKSLNKDQIVCFILLSGQEILGRFVEYDTENDGIVLSKTRTVNLTRSPDGVGVVLMPFTINALDGNVTIYRRAISASSPVLDKIESKYIEETTGIIL